MLLIEFLIWTFCGVFNFLSWKYTGCLKLFTCAYFILNLAGKNLFARCIWIKKMLCSFFLFMYRTLPQVAFAFFRTNVTPSIFCVPSHLTLPSLTLAADVLVPFIQGQPKLSFTRYWNTEFANSIPGCPVSILFFLSLTLPLCCMLSLSIVINSTIFNVRRKYWCIAMKR